ncbi:LytTR family transcriptional regulator DNA-binding domain-containing protein [Desulfosporosinus sp.]|uniref:LytR/AlgR family response regulator transcription factor n=1 Tax=Desulfosporosinus sp. TaxID=157907 RepID=UPI0025C4FF6F|nr:LytTR family transcriptional regulator DNA-binding domain-containing protein [Desulfosporosinus sp.]MBC2721950.1 LytTR family transcriptional regulator DNA-binding domain-containing protein [Desulfosporosinus sp.]MBC2728445.1 LytTR family transcriptional regulator DNA-binding domain-containing protein [Desulfosporosinus sp.]
MISAVIADDEPLARDELTYLLKQCADIEIVGEATQGAEALEIIRTLKPDVAFLDIHMPNIDGLSLARKLLEEEQDLMIVFATAYDKHAIQAFEVNAVDYLLKPFDEERVWKTVERIRQRVRNPQKDAQNQTLNDSLLELLTKMAGASQSTAKGQFQAVKISKLAVQGEESVVLIDPKDILYVYRENRDVFIKTVERVYLTKHSLQTLEEKLASYSFFRPHRSYLVNLSFVRELVPWFNGAYTLILNDEKSSQVPVSRAYVKALKDVLEI